MAVTLSRAGHRSAGWTRQLHQLFVLQCQNCGISLCKKCAKGSLCLDCYSALPDDMQKKYNRQLKTPIIIVSVILLAIFIPLTYFVW